MNRGGGLRKYGSGDLSGDGKEPEDREEELRKYGSGDLSGDGKEPVDREEEL